MIVLALVASFLVALMLADIMFTHYNIFVRLTCFILNIPICGLMVYIVIHYIIGHKVLV